MKPDTKSLLGIFIFIPAALCAQTAEDEKRGFKCSEVYVQAGYGNVQLPYPESGNFRKLAPGSALLNQPYTQNGFPYAHGRSGMKTMMAGMTISPSGHESGQNRLKFNLGVAYSGGILSFGYTSYGQRKVFDTIRSAHTGTMYYLDSVTSKTLWAREQADELRLDFSFTVSTATHKRFSFYGGLGISAGFSYLHNTIITENSREQIELRQGPIYQWGYISSYSGFARTEYYKNNNYFVWSAFVPMGLNFRLGKKSNPHAPVQLYYEMRPSMHIRYLTETGRTIYPGLHHAAGLRLVIAEHTKGT